MARPRSLVPALARGAIAAALVHAGRAGAQITDPIPERIPRGLSAEIVDFIQIPPSSSARPLARINLPTHAGDGSCRRFVDDVRGKIYAISPQGELSVFLDVAAALGPGKLDTAEIQTEPGSKRELMRVAQPTRDHNVGQIAFDPNARPGDADYGKLYVAMGNGGYPFGSPPNPFETGQDRSC